MMRVQFFGQARSATGVPSEDWEIDHPMTLAAFWDEAIRRHPALADIQPHCRVASNFEYVSQNQMIDPSGEAAIIPPVSGG